MGLKIFEKMDKAGWLGWPITACCVAHANGTPPFAAAKTTRTFKEFAEGKAPPSFDEMDAESMALVFMSGTKYERLPVLVNRQQGFIRNERNDHGHHTMGYLEDIQTSSLRPR
jgi:hypothetical protein